MTERSSVYAKHHNKNTQTKEFAHGKLSISMRVRVSIGLFSYS
jgi:hypothetical protein